MLCKKGRSGADLGEGVVDSFHDAFAGEGRAGGRIHFGGLGCDDGVGNGLESRVGDARGLAVGQDLDLADLVAVHGDFDPDGAAEALALADVLVVSQGLFGGVLGRGGLGLHVAEVNVQQLGGFAGHVGADAAAAGQAPGVAHLGDAGGGHEGGDAVGAVHGLGDRGGLGLDLRLVDGQVGGGVPVEQLFGDGRGVIRGAHQADDSGRAAQRAAQRAGTVARLAVHEHFGGDGGVGEAHFFLQLGQQGVGHSVAAAVLIKALVGQLLHPVQIELTGRIGVGRDLDLRIRGHCLGGRLGRRRYSGRAGAGSRLGAAGQTEESQPAQGQAGFLQERSAGL